MQWLPESATKMLSSESTKRCQGFFPLPGTHNSNKIALRIKYLQPIATKLSHHNVPIRQKTNTNGVCHLTLPSSKRSKLHDKLTFRVENLNAIVVAISHDIISLLVNNNTTRGRELSITLPMRPKKKTRMKAPFSSKIWMRWLSLSATTIWLFLWSTITPRG